ncbi:MAG: NAD(P)H-hydrate dehydratase [Bacteroidetes bacterium]|nr:NAD(P)H-hydrate dehydratase [Bacteroidota bacterium]
MKILNAEQIRAWDQYTIELEPISSINLMERAATRCLEWLEVNDYLHHPFVIFCGKGNNGGDGLAVARKLSSLNCKVIVYILEFGHKGTEDFQTNLARLHQQALVDIRFIQAEENFHAFTKEEIIIDALLGSGLNRPLEGVTAKLVEYINQSGNEIISIDIPSGLSTDHSSKGNTAINASHTLSFQCYKLAFLLAENAIHIGKVHILDIGLHKDFHEAAPLHYRLVDAEWIQTIYKPGNEFAHKGNFGHAAIIAGSTGFMGAAVLASKACMRSGVGKLTAYIPKTGYDIIQVSVPEAMAFISGTQDHIEHFHPVTTHEAIGIGPGIGITNNAVDLLKEVVQQYHSPMVIDADALTILSKHPALLKQIPPLSILTPHPKEFERLFGSTENEVERIQLAEQKAKELNLIIVLKGHHTLIATPGAISYFNTTGNSGMATAGSGDVLTGILTGLLAQGYSPVEAALFGVYLHGTAGDIAAEKYSKEAMIAGDIIECLGEAFLLLKTSL